MAAAGSPTPVSDDLVHAHMEGWIAFTKFVKIGTVSVIAILALMAIFLL
jgi:hypothetical protein